MKRMLRDVACVAFVIGANVALVQAQAGVSSAELTFGVASLSIERFFKNRTVGVIHLGGAVWLSRHWGVGAQHTWTAGDGIVISNEIELWRPNTVSGQEHYRYSIATIRYRAFLRSRWDVAIGIGTRFAGKKERHVLERRPLENLYQYLTEEELAFYGPTDERTREPWGDPAMAVEMLIGYAISDHLGVMGGLTLLRDVESVRVFQPAVLGRVSF